MKENINLRAIGKRIFTLSLSRPWLPSAGLVLLYFILALAAYWPAYPGDVTRVVGCPCGDAAQSAWFLRWVPYAILHGHNPLFTNWINVPYGANLAQNTLMPLLGLVMTPITLILGPMASFNLLAWLAFPLSAASMFYVARKLHLSRFASFTAGLLFGFSPYMVGQGEGHVMLTFVPLLPLIMLSCWRLFIQQDEAKSPYKVGIVLAIEVATQYFIDPEVMTITVMAVLLGLVVLALSRHAYLTKERLQYAVCGLAVTAIICVTVFAYPVWFMAFGPQHFKGPNFPPGNPYRSDLVGLVVPMLNQRFMISYFHHYAMTTADSGYSEVGDYVGIIVLAVIAAGMYIWRRNRWLVFSAIMALLIWIGSLGPRLIVNTHKTQIVLPFAVITKIPLLQDMLPSRLSLAEWFFVAIAVAIIITEWQKSKQVTHVAPRLLLIGVIVVGVVAAAVVLSLLPRWPYPTKYVNEPSYFKGSMAAVEGKTVLAYPLPIYTNDRFMLWQADSNMSFKLIGSYIQNPSVRDTQSQMPPLLSPVAVEEWLSTEQGGTPWVSVKSVSTADLIMFLRDNDVGAIMIDSQTVNSTAVARAFSAVLRSPANEDGVLVWSNVQHMLH